MHNSCVGQGNCPPGLILKKTTAQNTTGLLYYHLTENKIPFLAEYNGM